MQNIPVPVEMMGIHDSFGQTGTADQLLQFYKMKAVDVAGAVKKVIKRKKD